MSTPSRALFAGLVDDAAMFPPGNATAGVALSEHLRYRMSWFADLVGPLLVPAKAFEAFVDAHKAAGSPEVTVVLIGTTEQPVEAPPAVTVAGFESPVADVPLPPIAEGLSFAAETRPGAAGERVLEAVAKSRRAGNTALAKYRTGGTTADAFPSEAELAGIIWAANAVPVPLKLTAGLHHAVRFTDEDSGFEHHGFLNVMVAAARAMAGGDRAVVTEALATRASAPLVAEVRDLSADEVSRVRSRFVSFGCCGVEDPINDLVELGLVEEAR